jgi:hypothetical protein
MLYASSWKLISTLATLAEPISKLGTSSESYSSSELNSMLVVDALAEELG